MTKITGDREYYSFTLLDHSTEFSVAGFSGSDSISELFEYSVDLISDDTRCVIENLLRKSATLTLYGDNSKNSHRCINGVIVEAEYNGQDQQHRYVRVKLCPFVKLLTYRSDSRIFQDMSVQEIIQSVFKHLKTLPVSLSFSLQDHYEKKQYCVQYQETDFAFISRLIADAGLFYFFEHSETDHCFIVADNIAAYKDVIGDTQIRYNEITGYETHDQVVSQLSVSNRVRSTAVAISDYNYLNPSLRLNSEKNENNSNDLAQFDYPADFNSIRAGQSVIKRRLESMQVYKKILIGKSDCKQFQAGHSFLLHGHPESECNREYLIVEVKHLATQPSVKRQNAFSESGTYANQFRCIPADTLCRPQFKGSRRPIMRGIQTATVVGPQGEEIFTDEYGRVKVQFHWDRYGNSDESSSCWLRVSQSWSGNGWGSMFIPRISQEVIVDFVDGDPDKPVITGCLFNANNMPPLALPKNKSISGIKSNTLKQEHGSNQFLMDDKVDETRVELSCAYGHKIIQDEKERTLTIHTRDNHSLRMDDKNKQILIQTNNNHQIEMQDADSTGEGNIDINSSAGHRIQLDDSRQQMALQTTAGHYIVLDDKAERVDITSADGRTICIDDKDQRIALISKNGHRMKIDDEKDCILLSDKQQQHQFSIDIGNQKISITTTTGSIDLRAPDGEVSISSKDLNIDVSNDIAIKAGNNIKTQAAMELSASANLVRTESAAAHVIKGLPVQLN